MPTPVEITLAFPRKDLANAVRKLFAGRTDRREIADTGYVGLIIEPERVILVDRDRRVIAPCTASAHACAWLPSHVFADARLEFESGAAELTFRLRDGECETGLMTVEDNAIAILEYSSDPRFKFASVAAASGTATYIPSDRPKPGLRDAYRLLRGVDEGFPFEPAEVERLQKHLKKTVAKFTEDLMAFKVTEADIFSLLDWKIGIARKE